ncbi:MAG: hypothetical protein LLF99_06630 [Desulfobacteraceae bacterium]|nr:hypothetical protein [Desulfobacteraceae bacterium]
MSRDDPTHGAGIPKEGERACALVFAALAAIGAATFLIGVFGPEPQRAWQTYHINLLFWSGLAFGTVLFSAALNMSLAKWGRPVKRLAEAPGAFLPVAFVLFCLLYFGREAVFPWGREPVHGKEFWLNAEFVFLRDGLSFLVLTGLAVALIYYSVRGDLALASGAAEPRKPGAAPVDGKGSDVQIVVSTVYGILYSIVVSLLGYDLVMSLDPHWVSTLFGAYFFIGAFYCGLSAILILSAVAVKSMGMGGLVTGTQFHDVGKLLLAFCIVAGDFFYCQFFVIWYGNLPEETRYILLRLRMPPWNYISWTVLLTCFVIPFVILLSKRIKTKPVAMMALGIFILSGMWLERYLLVVPSIWPGSELPLGFVELFITAGFFGIVALCVLFFLKRFPLVPVSDPMYREYLETAGKS